LTVFCMNRRVAIICLQQLSSELEYCIFVVVGRIDGWKRLKLDVAFENLYSKPISLLIYSLRQIKAPNVCISFYEGFLTEIECKNYFL